MQVVLAPADLLPGADKKEEGEKEVEPVPPGPETEPPLLPFRTEEEDQKEYRGQQEKERSRRLHHPVLPEQDLAHRFRRDQHTAVTEGHEHEEGQKELPADSTATGGLVHVRPPILIERWESRPRW